MRPGRFHAATRAGVALAAGLTLLSLGQAQTSINASGIGITGNAIDDAVLYRIGGGHAVPMSHTGDMASLGVGIGWNSNLVCGKLSLTTTIHNQLNGITAGFQSIMSAVIQNATAAVASLPALIIQRADPGLYNLLTNGVLQARLDFDRSKLTCQSMANRMANIAGGEMGWGQLASGMALSSAVDSGDAVAAIQTAEASLGNNGVTWVGGTNAGGAGQAPINIVSDVTRAGYNLLNGRGVTDASPIDPTACDNSLTCQTWSSPDAAAAWAVRVLGETQQRTCDGCTKTRTTPGVGLTPLVLETYNTTIQALKALVTGSEPITATNLAAAGNDSVPITRGVIEALRDEPDRDVLAQRLASEIALSSVLEQALTLQRALLTGREEPNVAANKLAQDAISHQSGILEQEIGNLRVELEVRRELAANSPMTIIERQSARSEASHGIFQGDPTRDRLDQIQRPGGTD